MIYVMSDLHGCYEEFLHALEDIHFSKNDTLYILGDIVDRGEKSIELLQYLMMQSNIIPILGNHEYMMYTVLKKLTVEVNEDNIEDYLDEEDMLNYIHWITDGGNITCKQYCALSYEDKLDILEYLEEFSLYEEVTVNNETYILVHAGLEPFDKYKPLEDYGIEELLFTCPDYYKTYYEDQYVINGHRVTQSRHIEEMNHHIAIDCGVVYGGNLGVYCLDTKECIYINRIS